MSLVDWVEDDDLLQTFAGVARFYEGQGLYGQALPWYETCVRLSTERLGEEHPDVATSLNNLAELYRSQGRYAEAEPLYLQAIAIATQRLGQEHPNTQTMVGNFIYMLKEAIAHNQADQLSDHPLTQHHLEQIRNETAD